jgi:hypothetical protein
MAVDQLSQFLAEQDRLAAQPQQPSTDASAVQTAVASDPFKLLSPEYVYENREALGSTSPKMDTMLGNVPGSTVDLADAVTYPIRHPIDFTSSMIELGSGIINLATPGEQPSEATAKAVGQYIANRYGSLNAAQEALINDPMGVIADATAILTLGGTGLARMSGKAGQIAKDTANIATKVDPVVQGIQGIQSAFNVAAPVTNRFVSRVQSMLQGTGQLDNYNAFMAAKRGGQAEAALLDNMRGNVEPKVVVEAVMSKLKDESRRRAGEYQTGMRQLEQTKMVDMQPIIDELAALKADAYAKGTSKATLETPIMVPGSIDLLTDMEKMINQWKANPELQTVTNMDGLKILIDDMYKMDMPKTSKRLVASMRSKVYDEIVKQVPEYADIMKAYEQSITLQSDLEKVFSASGKAMPETTLRKLQGALRDNVNTSFNARASSLKQLDNLGSEANILESLTGQSLRTAMPRGLPRLSAVPLIGTSATLNPAMAALLAAGSSPRLTGEISMAMGRAQRNLAPAMSALPEASRISRVAGDVSQASQMRPEQPGLNDEEKQFLRMLGN